MVGNLLNRATAVPSGTRRRPRVTRREPALRSSRAERVAADLEHEILSARLPVGAHLGRRSELMDRFGISPTVMNETLRILRDRDLVAVRPGPGGGITVASAPPQVRVGALDLWFQPSNPHPLDLFEARLYLEFGLTKAAFERATGDDVAAMRSAMVAMRASTDPRQFFDSVLAFHGVVAAAAHIPVLEGMHQLIVTSIKTVLTGVVFVGDHEPLLARSLGVHDDIVAAIALHDQSSFVDAINRHDQDLIRPEDPDRTPNTPQHP
jgi:DNA-binding FadR family transcriptional regulator